MGLFSSANRYKDGPGVPKDAPRKRGIARFFEIVGRDLRSLFLANLLTCLGFLPWVLLVSAGLEANNLLLVILGGILGGLPAGPVLAGMYDTVLRALRDEPGYWWATYRRAFKQNVKASLLPGLFFGLVVAVQLFLVKFCFRTAAQGGRVGLSLWVVMMLNLLLFHMLFSYLWPQVVLLDQPFSLTLKNSLRCMIACFPRALASAFVTVLFWGVVLTNPQFSLPLTLLLGFWFQTEVCCQIVYGDLNRIFRIEANIRKLHEAEWDTPSES